MNSVVAEIEALFARHGGESYGEGVTMLQHALQTAALAQAEGADDGLVVAALLHDVGHFLQPTDDSYGYHKHDRSGGDWLAQRFVPAVSEPVRLHVAAKRYLCARGDGTLGGAEYWAALSIDSKRSLELQGGIFSAAEADAFHAQPYATDGVRLRQWDDQAKRGDAVTPPLSHYLDLAARVAR